MDYDQKKRERWTRSDTEEWIYDVTPQHEWSIQSGVSPANTLWGRGGMYGESTWTSSAGSDVDGSQLEDKWERKGRAGKSGYFTLLHGLISTSTMPVQKPASSRSVLLSFSRPQLHDLLTFFNSLILFFTSILANFHSFFQAVSCTYENIQFPQPRRISFLFIRVRGASQLGVWRRYRTYINTPCL